jgi:hypothetical protein
VLVTDRQTPAPLQVRCGVSVEPTQVAAAHCVPSAQKRQAPMPLHMPSSPHVVAAVATHWVAGVGAVPLATLLHVPRLPASAHDLQAVLQAWSQQYPCAQKPESHSPGPVHAAPIGFSVQALPLQMLGVTQSGVLAQVVRQAPAVVSQVYRPHGCGVAARQTPAPSQVRASNPVVAFMHIGAPHWVPAMCRRQPPSPLQVPSLPQVEAAAAGHCDATSGGWPAGISEQVPTLPVNEQDMQVPVQVVSQQTLLTQLPEAQSAPIPDGQAPPIGILPQLIIVQTLPLVHSVEEEHIVRHAFVPHVNGAHELVVAARHTPAPSHVRGDDSVNPVHVAAPQLVPAA